MKNRKNLAICFLIILLVKGHAIKCWKGREKKSLVECGRRYNACFKTWVKSSDMWEVGCTASSYCGFNGVQMISEGINCKSDSSYAFGIRSSEEKIDHSFCCCLKDGCFGPNTWKNAMVDELKVSGSSNHNSPPLLFPLPRHQRTKKATISFPPIPLMLVFEMYFALV